MQHSGKEPTRQGRRCKRQGFQSPGWEDPLEEEMATPPVFLQGESRGQRSLAGYRLWVAMSQT